MTLNRELRRLAKAAEFGAARTIMSLPTAARRALLRGKTTQRDGAPLDPDVELMILLAKLSKKGLALDLPLAQARRRFVDETNVFARPEVSGVRTIEERVDDHVTVRVYTPDGPAVARGLGPRAGLVYFHGGGFVLGGLASHDVPCRRLAREAGVVVVSVDYRLAPESRFPTAVTDSLAAFRWTVSRASRLGLDPARLGVGGDSAGGNLAAVVALETRGDAVRPRAQILIYPAVDFTMSSSRRRRSSGSASSTSARGTAAIPWRLRSSGPISPARRGPSSTWPGSTRSVTRASPMRPRFVGRAARSCSATTTRSSTASSTRRCSQPRIAP
jgi:acetyl esterase